MQGEKVVQLERARAARRAAPVPVPPAPVTTLSLLVGRVHCTVETEELAVDFQFSADQAEDFAYELLHKARAARAHVGSTGGHVTTTDGPILFQSVQEAPVQHYRAGSKVGSVNAANQAARSAPKESP